MPSSDRDRAATTWRPQVQQTIHKCNTYCKKKKSVHNKREGPFRLLDSVCGDRRAIPCWPGSPALPTCCSQAVSSGPAILQAERGRGQELVKHHREGGHTQSTGTSHGSTLACAEHSGSCPRSHSPGTAEAEDGGGGEGRRGEGRMSQAMNVG